MSNCNKNNQDPKYINHNKYYKTSDGWFDFYVNIDTHEKKFKLDDTDILVERR